MSEDQGAWPTYVPLEGVYLSYLLIAEQVLIEVDGVQSHIRLIDTWSTNGEPPPVAVAPNVVFGLRGLDGKKEVVVDFLIFSVDDAGQESERLFASQLVIPTEVVGGIALSVRPQMTISHFGDYRISIIVYGHEMGRFDFGLQADPIHPDEVKRASLIAAPRLAADEEAGR